MARAEITPPVEPTIKIELNKDEFTILSYAYRMFIGGDNAARDGIYDAIRAGNAAFGLERALTEIRRSDVCVDIGMGDYLDTNKLLERLR